MTLNNKENCHLCGIHKDKAWSGTSNGMNMYGLDHHSHLVTPDGTEKLTAHLCYNCAGIYKNGEDDSNSENDKKVKALRKADQIKKLKIIEKYLKENPNAQDKEGWKLEAWGIREEYNLPKEQLEQPEREREQFNNYALRYSN